MGIFSRKPAPLTGAPAVRRIKSYAAESGYVYEYYYAGQRPWRDRLGGGVEFEFHVSVPGARWLPATVIVAERDVSAWEAGHLRTLSATERYAIAKLALFASFDQHARLITLWDSPKAIADSFERSVVTLLAHGIMSCAVLSTLADSVPFRVTERSRNATESVT